MIELLALTYFDTSHRISEAEAGRWERSRTFSQPQYGRTFHLGNAHLHIMSNRPVESFWFDGPDLSLVCDADLLEAQSTAGNARKSMTPAARLAELYGREGDSFAARLHATFAIILYDKRRNELKAWIDHFGVRRLVFARSEEFLAVATDLRRLARVLNEPPEIDPAALLEYMQYSCIPAPRTIYRRVHKLEPGHQLTSAASPMTRAYWDMSYAESRSPVRGENDWAPELFESIQSAVRRTTSVPGPEHLGCFLSGGTDSSSVTGLVGKLTGCPPRTFSIGFDHSHYNEISYARIAAARYGSDHHEYFVKPQDILDLLPRAAAAYDEPFGNSSVIPSYYCARLAAEHGVTHMLAGDGGDELFGGNERYVKDRVFSRYADMPRWARTIFLEPAVKAAAATIPLRLFDQAAKYCRRANMPLPDRLLSYSFLSETPLAEFFSPDFLAEVAGHHPLGPARRHFEAARASNNLNRWLYLDLKITITDNDLNKVTRMAELAGVLPRYPLLDHALAEFSGTIPAELKVKGGELRYLFKKAMAQILPTEILKKSKHGFGLPYSIWVGEYKPLRDFTFDVLGSSKFRQRGFFRPDFLEWLWSRYESISAFYYGDVLWMLLMFELWHANQHDLAGHQG